MKYSYELTWMMPVKALRESAQVDVDWNIPDRLSNIITLYNDDQITQLY